MKLFLDSNIVLDFLDSARPTHQDAIKIFQYIITNNIETYLSEDMLTTIYYISKDKQKVLEFFEKIMQLWKIVAFEQNTINEAITICKNNSTEDFEDVLQSLAAKRNGCHIVVTNDKKFYKCGVDILNSKEYLLSIAQGRFF